jgi:YD repeat-containing protein
VIVPFTVNALDEVTSAGTTTYAWDADGNLASRTTPAGTTTFSWDAEKRLTGVSGPDGTASYTRDALGFVASETLSGITSRFVNDPVAAAGAAATVLDAAGAITGRFDHGAALAAAVDAAGAASSFHFDAMGNTSVLSGPSGTASRTYSYDAHGNVTATTGSASNAYTTGGSGSARALPGGLFQGASTNVYDPAAGRLASTNVKGRSEGTNLYTRWKPMTLEPQGPPKTLGGKIDGGVQAWFWSKSFFGKFEPEPDDLGQFSPDALLEPAYNSVKGIVDASSASEQNDTLGTIEALGNSALADLELLSVAFPGLRPVTAGTKSIATVGKKACELYVANLAPNRDPYWFQPVPRNVWYYYRKNEGDGPVPPEIQQLLERTGPKDQVFPGDPNAKDATAGSGPRHRVRAGSRIFYNVSFENVPSASAPAQEVFVTDVLDGALDLSTLELVDAGWSSTTVAAPEGARSFRTRAVVADHRPSDARTWWVDVDAGETSPGRLAFTFRTVDPSTGALPGDPLAGFLPPNDATGRGEGWALFSVRTKTGLPPGTRIANAATIVFDTEAPITTNEVFHTIGLPGDVNDDGLVDPADVFYLVAFLYSGGPSPLGIADANADGKTDALDLFYLVNHLYAGGPAPL